jgi:DNA repair exonuclease SbcCD ATPase subunit
MFITIKGFRSLDHYEVEFQHESITLLSGSSGIGKTTIMNAIYWCLYGTLKNVRKFGIKSGICSVCIEFSNLKITRSKSPESFLVQEKEVILKDDEAQEKIIQLFGSADIWLASCYLRQGTRNRFIESSPSDRLDLLNQLCYSSDSPDLHLEKIEDRCKTLTKEFERKNDFFKRDLEVFQKKRKDYPNYTQDLLDQETKQTKISESNPLEILQQLENQLIHAERKESSYQSMKRTRENWIQSFPDYLDHLLTPESIEHLQQIISQPIQSPQKSFLLLDQEIQILEKNKVLLNHYRSEFEKKNKVDYQKYLEFDLVKMIARKEELPKMITEREKIIDQEKVKRTQWESYNERKKKLEEQLASLPENRVIDEKLFDLDISISRKKLYLEKQKLLEPWIPLLSNPDIHAEEVEDKRIEDAVIREKKMEERNQYLNSLSIQINQSSVSKAIQIREKIVQVQPLWTDVIKIQELEGKVQEIDEKIEGLGRRKDWILEKDLSSKQLELQTSRTAIHCPKCKTSLRYDQQQLIEVSGCHPKEKLDQLEKLLEDSKKRIEWKKEKERLDLELNQRINDFDQLCKERNMNQDDVFSFPKLEMDEMNKIILEKNRLEEIVNSWEDVLETKGHLENMRNKWLGQKLQDECSSIEDSFRLEDFELEKKDWIQFQSKRQVFEAEKNQIEKIVVDFQFVDILNEEKQLSELKLEWENIRETIEKVKESKECLDLDLKIKSLEEIDLDQVLEMKKQQKSEKEQIWEMTRNEILNAKEKLNLHEKAKTIADLSAQMDEIKLDDIDSIKSKMNQVRKNADEAMIAVMKAEKAEILAKEKDHLTKERSELVDLSNRVSSISKIKLIANELQHQRMISLLETINDFANELLTILFDDPIKIEFSIFKQLKTKDKVKPAIHYKIFYKGFEVDHIDQISGGEGDRVSLAVTCALFQFSKFPFLLLDEFASSLDLNTKENAIKTLKASLGIGMNQRKSIVCISHDTVEGIYDHTIRLGLVG